MIDAKELPKLKEHIETLTSQLSFFEAKVKDTPDIEPGKKGPEEERERIVSILTAYKKKLPEIETEAGSSLSKAHSHRVDMPIVLKKLRGIDDTFKNLKQDVEQFADDQYACKLDVHKQEVINTVGLILDSFDFVLPNIRYELNYMEKYYKEPANKSLSVFPELNDLVEKLEEHSITFNEFFNGYNSDDEKIPGKSVV